MIMSQAYDEEIEYQKTQAMQLARSLVEKIMRPSLDRRNAIAVRWANKNWWTSLECASLFLGVDPDTDNLFTDADSRNHVLSKGEIEEFDRLVDLLQRRFGDRVNPRDACKWAATIGMKQDCFEQAWADGEAKERNFRNEVQKTSRVRKEDITKHDLTRSKLLYAMAVKRGFSENGRSSAVGRFKNELDQIGLQVTAETIHDCLTDATQHYSSKKSLRDFYEDRHSTKPAKPSRP